MRKSKDYKSLRFHPRAYRKVIDTCRALSSDKKETIPECAVEFGEERWSFDNLEEFFVALARPDVTATTLSMYWDKAFFQLYVASLSTDTRVSVSNEQRSTIESVFAIFEETSSDDRIQLVANAAASDADSLDPDDDVRIFIGHGRNPQWEKLKAHLQDKHDLEIISYETGARAGHTIRDILDNMAEDSSFAILVLTGEDKTDEGLRARQNVIHECGLFQGRLGFDRAILVVEDGVQLASNFDGIQQLRFKRGRISEVFGDVLATIRREFGPI